MEAVFSNKSMGISMMDSGQMESKVGEESI